MKKFVGLFATIILLLATSVGAQQCAAVFFVGLYGYEGRNLTNKYQKNVIQLADVVTTHVPVPLRNIGICTDIPGMQNSLANRPGGLMLSGKKGDILSLFRRIPFVTRTSAPIFVFLNGHGIECVIGQSKYVAFETLDGQLILLEEFRKIANEMGGSSNSIVFFFNACRTSGSTSQVREVEKILAGLQTSSGRTDPGNPKSDHQRLDYVFYACRSGEKVSAEKNAFLGCLVEGLSGAADAQFSGIGRIPSTMHDGSNSTGELRTYIEHRYSDFLDQGNDPDFSRIEKYSQMVVSQVDKAFVCPSWLLTGVTSTIRVPDVIFGDYDLSTLEVSQEEDYRYAAYPKYLPAVYRYTKENIRGFQKSNFQSVYFGHVDLSGIQFESGSLKWAVFDHCNLSGTQCGTNRLRFCAERESFEISECD